MRDLSSPSEMMRQDSRDERMLRAEQDARWGDGGVLTLAGSICRPANAARAHRDAWAVDPRCAVCEKPTPSPEQSAHLDTPAGAIVTCRGYCFAVAVNRMNPTFNRHAALRRAED